MKIPPAQDKYEHAILDWVTDRVKDGLAVLRRERSYAEMPTAIRYINGDQTPPRPKSLSRLSDNRLKKVVQEITASLTEVRPIWNYETLDSEQNYKNQAEILSKLARAWWKNSRADLKLQSTLWFSCVGGSGYAYLRWNADLPGGGDIEVVPLDPRDIVPIDPIYSESLQDWGGVIIKRTLPLETVRHMYPLKRHKIGQTRHSLFSTPSREASASFSNLMTSMWSVLWRSGTESTPRDGLPDVVDLLYIFMKDESINTSDKTIEMGDPGTNWSYSVPAVGSVAADGHTVTEDEALLYPRGRLIICTPDAVCEDGPNPYWHGYFPVIRFTLDPMPVTLLGSSIVGDLIPLQNSLNEALRGVEDGVGQWVRRGVVADQSVMSKSNLDRIDTRQAGLRASVRNTGGGAGFQVLDGPQFPPWYIQMIQFFKDEIDDLSGVRGLQQLAQLKQMPSADTLDKYMEALSPVLKGRARMMEVSLGELAEMIKVNFFQYYDTRRRFQILGKDGLTLEDFDYDPGSMVPDEVPGAPPGADRTTRATHFHRNFKFEVAANTFLNVSHTEQKMLYLQMFRANAMDIYSLWDAMDVANPGKPPAETVADRMVAARKLGLQPGPTPEMVQMQNQLMMAQLQMQMAQLGQAQFMGGPPGPGGGPPQGGAPPNSGVGPEGGRPPTGQSPPTLVPKDGGMRSVVSESGR